MASIQCYCTPPPPFLTQQPPLHVSPDVCMCLIPAWGATARFWLVDENDIKYVCIIMSLSTSKLIKENFSFLNVSNTYKSTIVWVLSFRIRHLNLFLIRQNYVFSQGIVSCEIGIKIMKEIWPLSEHYLTF